MSAISPPVVVVTGGAGFIGSHMVDLLLDRGYRVRVIDNLVGGRRENLLQHETNPNLSVHLIDVRSLPHDSDVFSGADMVFHFAGIGDIVPSIDKPAEYLSVNVQGTVAVLEAARHARVRRVVYAASSSCYGLASVPTREDHPIDPQYPYALSKYQGEQALFHWARVYGLGVNAIRIFNAYGVRSRTSGAYGAVFGVFLRQKLAGAPFTVVGDGQQRRDFVYATDVAEAFFLAGTTKLSGEVFNVGAGNPQTVNRIIEILGGDRVPLPKRPGEPDCTWADIGKITKLLGWSPKVSFEDGVGRMVEQLDYWRDAPLWTPDKIADATRGWFNALEKDNC